MDKRLLISIIVPVYNAEKYLPHCLDSLLDQGISHDSYEIICINDGSHDNSLAILEEYAEKYSNIVVIDKKNEGVSATRNKGLDIALGDYVWFVDADDWIARYFLSNVAFPRLFGETQKSIPLMMLPIVPVNENEVEKYYNAAVSHEQMMHEEARPFMTSVVGHLISKSLLDKYSLRFDTNLSYGEDLMFMREFLDKIRFENEIGSDHRILQCSGKTVYFYRQHQSSTMGQLGNRLEKVAESILYRARWSMKRYKMEDQPDWYRANYQEYVNLNMQEYMIYYFPALNKSMRTHLRELKKEGLYPAPPPKLGWTKQQGMRRKLQQFAFKHPMFYPLFYIVMRMKFKKAGTV